MSTPGSYARGRPRPRGAVHIGAAGRAALLLLICSPQLIPLCGCGSGPQIQAAGATEALPTRALTKLDELAPEIPQPVNPPAAEEPVPEVSSALAEAEEHMAAGKWAEAVKVCEQAIEELKDLSPVGLHRALGLAHAAQDKTDEAIKELGYVRQHAPDDLEVQLVLGRLLAEQGDSDQAILALRTALKCSQAEPSSPLAAEALLELASLLQEEGFWTAALECYETLGNWLDKHGPAYRSRPKLRELVLQPERLLSTQGDLLLSLRRPSQAAEALELAFHRNRTDAPTARRLVEAYLATKDYARAEALLVDLAGEQAQRAQVPRLAEMLCRASGDKQMPQRIWQAYVEKHNINPTLAVALAKVVQQLGDVDKATDMLQSVLEKMPGNAEVAIALAELHAADRQGPRALRLLAELLVGDEDASAAVKKSIQQVILGHLQAGFETSFARQIETEAPEVRPALHYLAGLLAESRSNGALAIEQYRLAIQADKDFLPANEAIVDMYLAQKGYAEAVRLAAGLGELGEGGYFPHYIQGKIELARGQLRAAVEALQRSRSRNSRHVPTLLLLGQAYERLGQAELARRVLLEAINLAPDEIGPYRSLFRLYCALRGFRQAQGVAAKILRDWPDSIVGRLMLVEVALLTGRQEEAAKRIAELEKRYPDNVEVRVLAIRVQVQSHRGLMPPEEFDQAVAGLARILAKDPDNADARRLLAELLTRPGKDRQGAAVWGRLYEETGGHADVAKTYAAILSRLKEYEKAAQVLDRLRAGDPADFWTRRMLVTVLEKSDAGRAAELSEQWLEQTDSPTEALWYRLRLLRLYRKLESYDKAQKLVDDWMALPQTGGALRSNLRAEKLQLYRQAKQYDVALAYGQRWIQDEPSATAPKDLVIAVLADAKQYDRAQATLDQWIAAGDPKLAAAFRYRKIQLHVTADQLEQAERYVDNWLEESPQLLLPRAAIVSALTEAKKHQQALTLVDGWLKHLATATAPATQPAAPDAAAWCHVTAVRLLLAQSKYKDALDRAEAYAAARPADPELLGLLSSCLLEAGRDDEAIAALEKALALQPDDRLLNNDLGYLYADKGVQLEKAEQMIRKALAGRPNEINVLDSLGWVFYKQQRYREAGQIFQRLLRREDDEADEHPVIFDHAGDVYYRLGASQEALEFWSRALELAEKQESRTSEIRRILTGTPEKIKAVQAGQEPRLAPAGKGRNSQQRKAAPGRVK